MVFYGDELSRPAGPRHSCPGTEWPGGAVPVTAFILAAAGLVLVMTPELALFYGGLHGAICLGIFVGTAVNADGVDGLLAGNPGRFFLQVLGAVVVSGYAFVVSWVIFKVLDATIGLRLTDEAEVAGLDSTEHSETAYNS